MERPFIYTFMLNKDAYCFDINTNSICKINDRIYKFLSDCSDKELLDEADVLFIENMKKSGLLKPNQIKKIKHPMTDFVDDFLKDNLSRITLQVTQNCNFRCAYCVYSGSYYNRKHNNKRMDWETAKQALDFLNEHSKKSSEINISFYGGEPLLEIELIKLCVDYAKTVFNRKKLSFNLTTNASLLTDNMILYLKDENFLLTISLDGPQAVHDKNRMFADTNRGTYDVVKKSVIKINEIAPDFMKNITINAVLDDENDFSLINQYFLNEPIVKDIFVSTNYINDVNRRDKVENNSVNNYIEICYQKVLGMMYLLKRISREHVSSLVVREIADINEVINKRRISQQVMEEETHPGGPCLPGVQRPFVNAYGKLFPCERVNETCEEMCIGNIYDGFDSVAVKNLLNVGSITRDNCMNCWVFNYCTQCAATADDGEKMSSVIRLEKCNRIRKHFDGLLKDYIVLKEYGCDFTQTL